MKRKKIVAGNWKMNTTLEEAEQLIGFILKNLPFHKEVEKIVFPPFPFLNNVAHLLKGVDQFYVGAQNCSEHAQGAYTGEVSAAMLKSAGCSYLLVGHSERRSYFKENNEQLILKIKQGLAQNLKIIFCFGEQLTERRNNEQFETVKQQLKQVLCHFSEADLAFMALAYEPVWAIGTGETATPLQAQEMHAFIRKYISTLFSEKAAEALSILYGGSCNAQNAGELFACEDVDGGLIGGASLKAQDFSKIINAFG